KKGTSIATSAHFAAVRGILCVPYFCFISSIPGSEQQQQSDTLQRCFSYSITIFHWGKIKQSDVHIMSCS
ncbi:hypothetical protein, partial [Escherichia coli]|uniref:hypothetical protein n=1 Tax=Escherichia coli TaxID=562 RepID=UPI001A7E167E